MAGSCRLSLQPARLATDSGDEAAVLVLVDERLAAVLCRLDSPCHEHERGRWFLEVGFGRCAGTPDPFPLLADGLRWVADRFGATHDEEELVALADRAAAPGTAGAAAVTPAR